MIIINDFNKIVFSQADVYSILCMAKQKRRIVQ